MMAGDAAANPVAAAEAAVAEGVKKIQIYSSSSSSSSARQVTPFWKEKYERDAKKYWDIFYKRHQDRDKDGKTLVVLEGHKDFSADRINAFVCDLTVQTLSEIIEPSSVDIVTMVFVLSAVSPEKMPLVLHNIRKVLKPNGCVLFRDYATGDLAQVCDFESYCP
ncbi:Putative methyltransferase [Musa troglodytarum]|uniref:Methyltransferase n=1 Tax=Musa troglodytarum TaxID=320322 RepID=A0A9E7GZ01_9LILI|nr:Putative methyltransferase [Musa troglodytarum]